MPRLRTANTDPAVPKPAVGAEAPLLALRPRARQLLQARHRDGLRAPGGDAARLGDAVPLRARAPTRHAAPVRPSRTTPRGRCATRAGCSPRGPGEGAVWSATSRPVPPL